MVDIKKLRLDKGLTQEALARLCGLTTATIQNAENKGNMRLSTYHTILQTLQSYDDVNSNTLINN